MNIILFGPPGAGKGTQADNLVKDFNFYKVSTGDLLRKEIEKESSLGNKIKTIIDEGKLVSDDIIDNLIENVISNKTYSNRLIFDGYPRNLYQARNLDHLIRKNNQKIACVLSLKVDEDDIVKRILGRQICTKCGLTFNEFFKPLVSCKFECNSKFLKKRSDDNEKTVKNRFQTHVKIAQPILNYYQKQNLSQEIDAKRDISTIYREICGIINSLET